MARTFDQILGEPVGERDAFTKFIESMRIAEHSARTIALLRGDPQWLTVSNALGVARERASVLARSRTFATQSRTAPFR